MARYRKIDTRIWNDEKFATMSDRGKLAFLFILTHPHMTSLGAMRGTINGMASELGWPAEAFAKAFREASERGLVECDETASFVGVPKFLRYNGPASPNVVISWSDSLDLIPECRLKTQLLQRVKAFVEDLPEAFAKALPEAFRKTMPNQEQEQEQEQDVYLGDKSPETKPDEDKPKPKPKSKQFTPPTIQEVREFCDNRTNGIDPVNFVAYYQARGWELTKGRKMKDWRACVVTWERNNAEAKQEQPSQYPTLG